MNLYFKYINRYYFKLISCIIILLMSILTSWVNAGEWRAIPSLNISERYTDNFRLGSNFGGKSNDDFITMINPGINVTGRGRRFTADVNYMMNNIIYANNSGLSRMWHQLSANGTAELIENRLFIDGIATIRQQNASLLGPQGFDNSNPINRSNIRTLNISPYYRHRFGDLASAELRYTHGEVDISGANARGISTDSGLFSLNSGSAFRTFRWGLNYMHTEVNRDRLKPIALERSTALLRYMITPQFGLVATGGYERNSFISIRGKSSSPTWTVGFTWAPTERTDIEFSAGQRFFGDTYLANVNHRTRMTTLSFNYNESLTTFGQQALAGGAFGGLGGFGLGAGTLGGFSSQFVPNLQNAGINLDPGIPFAFFNPSNFLTNRLFLQRNLQAFLAINGRKSTVLLSGFNMSRRAFTADSEDELLESGRLAATLARDTDQTGGGISWMYRISPLTNATINYTYSRVHFLTADRTDDNQLIMLSLNKQFTPNINGILSYFHNRRNSERANADFNSNSITAMLNMTFN